MNNLTNSKIKKIELMANKGNKIAHSAWFILIIVAIYMVLFIIQSIMYGLGMISIGANNYTIVANGPNAWRGWLMITATFLSSTSIGMGIIFISRFDKKFIYFILNGFFWTVVYAISISLWLTIVRTFIMLYIPITLFVRIKMNENATGIRKKFSPSKFNNYILIAIFSSIIAIGLLSGYGISNISSPQYQDPTPYLDGLLVIYPLLSGTLMIFGYIDAFALWIIFNIIVMAQGVIVNNWILIASSVVNIIEDSIGMLSWIFIMLENKKLA